MTRLIGISGALRKASYNTALLNAAIELAPEGCELIAGSIHGIPLYDGDVEASGGIPPAVAALKDLVAGADGLILFTPEYNNGIPGVFKNALDWLSRPATDIARVFGGKPVALCGASPGPWGTALSQAAWLPVLRALELDIWSRGRLLVPRANTLMDAQGRLATPARASAWPGSSRASMHTSNFTPRRCSRKAFMETRPPGPAFTLESATRKVRGAEDAWNSRDPDRVSQVYTEDTRWRNRAEFPVGREEVRQFLARKWTRELDYRLVKELWTFTDNRIAVRFAYEWHDDSGQWFRSYGNENWEFNPQGLMQRRFASINDLPIAESARLFRWPWGRRPDEHLGRVIST